MTKFSIAQKSDCKRVVIKIGSALLRDNKTGKIRQKWLETVAEDIVTMRRAGQQVVLVSSGAIAMGQTALGFNTRPTRLEDAQAAAAIGQIKLAHAYETLFAPHETTVAQVLLTLYDLEDRARYLNGRNTLEALLEHGTLPIVNENDTVATQEIRFGDNDRLAARVAQLIKADALLILSDIKGLYTADPNIDDAAELISQVTEITPKIEAMAGPAAAGTLGSGGMFTKILAAKIATAAGCSLVISNGQIDNPIRRFWESQVGTVFTASVSPLAVRKQWLRGLMAPEGYLHIDAGAEKALRKDASLLPAGVTEVDGNFSRGDLVALINENGKAIGQGLVGYTAEQAHKMKGRRSDEAQAQLGFCGRSVIVHRDDLILF